MTNRAVTRRAKTMGLALGLVAAFAPFGCGGEQDFTVVPSSSSFDAPEVPPRTEQALRACAGPGVSRLSDTHYAVVFDLEVTRSGEVRTAKVRDSSLPDHAMESCMRRALEAMEVPRQILSRASRSRGMVSPGSRAPAGNVMVVAAAAELVPVLIVIAGVTIVVAVTVQVVQTVSETSTPTDEESERERCKKVKQACIAYCSDTTLPTGDFGWKFQKCKNDCLERRGCPRDS